MKHRMISMVASLLLAGLLPLAAQTQEWNSTSTLKGSGSGYQSQVTFVGAEKATLIPMTSTSSMMDTGDVPTPGDGSSTGAAKGPRRAGDFNETGESGIGDEGSPIGEPWVLLLFAAAGAGVIAYRRWRALQSTINNN